MAIDTLKWYKAIIRATDGNPKEVYLPSRPTAEGAQQTDTTLGVSGMPADAAAVGAALGQLKENSTHKLDKPTDAPAVGKVLKIKSVNDDGTFMCEWADAPTPDLSDYVKSTDYATAEKGGVIKTVGRGNTLISDGILLADELSKESFRTASVYSFIGKGTLNNVLSAPSSMPELTAEEQLAGRRRLGLDKEWVKIGTINNDNKSTGVAVDLSGCTELCMVGSGDATGNATITFVMQNNININALYYALSTTNKMFLGMFVDTAFGINCTVGKASNRVTTQALTTMLTNTFILGLAVNSIKIIRFFESNYTAVTDCNIEIYAR